MYLSYVGFSIDFSNLLFFFFVKLFFITPENTMDSFKYKIQLWENNNNKKNLSFLKANLQTTRNKNLRVQASEADYYIVIIHVTGEQVQRRRQPPELEHVRRWVAAMLVPQTAATLGTRFVLNELSKMLV